MIRITEKQKKEIVARLKNNEKIPDIARTMKINYSTLWSHLKIEKQKRALKRVPRKIHSSIPWATIIGFATIIFVNVFIFWSLSYGK